MNSMILVTCGATAADIRQELGPRCNGIQKVKHDDPIGNYGDFILDVTDSDGVFMKLKHPKVVRII